MSPTNFQLEARLLAACRRMFLCSQASAMNLDAIRVTGTKEFGRPSGEGKPEWEMFQMSYARAKLRSEREQVVISAEQFASAWKRQSEPTDREHERGSLAWKRAIANDERPASEVARLFSVSRQQVAGLIAQYREQSV